MKKLLVLIMSLLMCLSLVACNTKKATVSIDVPSFMYEYGEELSEEYLKELSKEEGFESMVLNDDSTLTITMTQDKHKEILAELAKEIDEELKMIVDDEEAAFTKIETKNEYTEYNAYLSTEELGYYESFASITFILFGSTYSLYNGKNPVPLTIRYYNSNNELLEEYSESIAFEEMVDEFAGIFAE
ncbi:MAG: hypothetical protein Q4B60_06495 [Erysipelotrichaceae bacterium]|nr:hypothetical protein [Erysipelotrichaceae bacterium]